MKGPWLVTSQYIGGKYLFAVYRQIDVTKTDHSGNREYATGFTDDQAEAHAYAEKLNKEEKNAE